jgi:hypothetical protein
MENFTEWRFFGWNQKYNHRNEKITIFKEEQKMKKGLILTVMLVTVLALVYSQSTSWTVTNVSTWVEAVNGIRSGGNNKDYTITVTGNVSVPPSTENTFGSVTGITITIAGSSNLSLPANGNLLQIGARQTIIVKDLTLNGRADNSNSLVYVSKDGIFRMEGQAKVTGNSRSGRGAGVFIGESGAFIMQDTSSVSGNIAYLSGYDEGGGGVFVNGGTFTMRGSATVSGNTVYCTYGADSGGGGVYIYNSATLIMQDRASVSGNTAVGGLRSSGEVAYIDGGGVFVYSGTFTMQDSSSVSNNKINKGSGGGVLIRQGTFTMQDNTSVSGNSGGGVLVKRHITGSGTFILKGNATVTGNKDESGGGGVTNEGTFIMESGTISGNNVVSSSNTSSFSSGGGVFNNATFTMKGGTISGNTASSFSNSSYSKNKAESFGGGVYNNATFTMQGGTISGNASISSSKGCPSYSYGGGVFSSATFTMQGGTISGNTTTFKGGGVYLAGGSFTKTGGTIYGDDTDQNLENTVISKLGYVVYNEKNGAWRNATAGPMANSDSYGFWLNDGDVAVFPSGFAGIYERSNFNNTLFFAENIVKSSSSNYLWILQTISGNTYTFKRSDTANMMTITIRLEGRNLVISGDSGSGENNWNGTWIKQ